MVAPTTAIVLGGSGFIGSHVADVLTDRGHEVTVFDIEESPYLRDGQRMLIGDITDPDQVREAVSGQRLVYNFAGIADIGVASEDPVGTVKANVLGNVNVLEAVRGADIDRYVFASTLYVYSDVGGFYRDSKVASELYIQDYNASYGVPFTILRFGSIYGPRTTGHDRIHCFVRDALEKRRMVYDGDGEEIREYIHVEDAARCAVDVLDGDFLDANVVISGNQPLKIRDLMIMVREIIGTDVEMEFRPESSELHYEITPYSFSPRLARKLVGGSYIDLGEGILQRAQELHREIGGDEAE